MKEQLISFETAKLAKEKGFDELTDNTWKEFHKDHIIFDYREGEDIVSTEKGTIKLSNRTPWHEEMWSYFNHWNAPTQSLLQKWLREVHDIFINIEEGKNPRNYYSNIRNKQKSHFSYKYHIPMWGETYEDALEMGLQEALKLI